METFVGGAGSMAGVAERRGVKHDEGKARWDLLPFREVAQLVQVLTFGAQEYGANRWQGVAPERYRAALLRHFSAYMQGEIYDPKSGIHHLAHVGVNVLFLLWHDHETGVAP